jgi:hypothetical protein
MAGIYSFGSEAVRSVMPDNFVRYPVLSHTFTLTKDAGGPSFFAAENSNIMILNDEPIGTDLKDQHIVDGLTRGSFTLHRSCAQGKGRPGDYRSEWRSAALAARQGMREPQHPQRACRGQSCYQSGDRPGGARHRKKGGVEGSQMSLDLRVELGGAG